MSSNVYDFANLSNLFVVESTDSPSCFKDYDVCYDYSSGYPSELLLIRQLEEGTAVMPKGNADSGLGIYLSRMLFNVVLNKEALEKCPLSDYGQRVFINRQLLGTYIINDIIIDFLEHSDFKGKCRKFIYTRISYGSEYKKEVILLNTVLDQEQTKKFAEIFVNGVSGFGSFAEACLSYLKRWVDTGKFDQDIEEFCSAKDDWRDYFKPAYWRMLQAKKKALKALTKSVTKRSYRYPKVLEDDGSFKTDGDAAITLKLPKSSKLAGKYLCYATVWGQGEGAAVGGIFDEIPEYINVLDEEDPGTDNAINSFETTLDPYEAMFFEYLPNEETFIDFYLEDENHGLIYFGNKQNAYNYWSEKLQGGEDW